MIYDTENQNNYLPEDATLSCAAQQGFFAAPSGIGIYLNKEQGHEDPYGKLSAKIIGATAQNKP